MLEQAQENGRLLKKIFDLLVLIEWSLKNQKPKVGEEQKPTIQVPRTASSIIEPEFYAMAEKLSCPRCGRRMQARKRRDGTGDVFFGCNDYPSCSGLTTLVDAKVKLAPPPPPRVISSVLGVDEGDDIPF